MCKVKSGALVENYQDVQNLVIGILNRQEKYYHIENIIYLVQKYLKGSSVEIQEEQLKQIISNNLDMLYIRNRVKCKNGCYIPQPLKYYSHYDLAGNTNSSENQWS